MVAVALGFAVAIAAPSSSAANSAPAKPGAVRQFFAKQKLRKVGRQIDRLSEKVKVWKMRGKPDTMSTGASGNKLLLAVVDSAHKTGRSIGDDKVVKAFNDVSVAEQDGFKLKLNALRSSLNELSGAIFIEGEMDSLFAADSNATYRAGIEGMNSFFRSVSQPTIRYHERNIGTAEIGFPFSDLFRREVLVYKLHIQ
jgi:hypothetical protein